MKTYFVNWEEPCEACNGTRVESNPEWDAYWAETNGHRDLPLDQQMAADEQWWAERGYYGSRRWPPEEFNCSECDGTGVRYGRVSLTEALADIGRVEVES